MKVDSRRKMFQLLAWTKQKKVAHTQHHISKQGGCICQHLLWQLLWASSIRQEQGQPHLTAIQTLYFLSSLILKINGYTIFQLLIEMHIGIWHRTASALTETLTVGSKYLQGNCLKAENEIWKKSPSRWNHRQWDILLIINYENCYLPIWMLFHLSFVNPFLGDKQNYYYKKRRKPLKCRLVCQWHLWWPCMHQIVGREALAKTWNYTGSTITQNPWGIFSSKKHITIC